MLTFIFAGWILLPMTQVHTQKILIYSFVRTPNSFIHSFRHLLMTSALITFLHFFQWVTTSGIEILKYWILLLTWEIRKTLFYSLWIINDRGVTVFIVCRITTYIHSGVFLILQIWNGKILPDIKAFPACDIFYLLYLIILFMKFLVVAGLKRLIMCINIFFYHSVIFSLFIHQTFKKNLFLYLSLLAKLKKPECLILCIFPAEITS